MKGETKKMKTKTFNNIIKFYSTLTWLFVVASVVLETSLSILFYITIIPNLYCIIPANIITFIVVLIALRGLHKYFVKMYNKMLIQDAHTFAEELRKNKMCRPELIDELITEVQLINKTNSKDES